MTITELYQTMATNMGPQHWLEPGIPPAETPWEILWGGILIQNTNWRNVDYSLANLKQATSFEPAKVAALTPAELRQLITPSGFYARKGPTLQALATWLGQYHYDLTAIQQLDQQALRQQLLAIKGIGPETADYFILYVFKQPTIIVDTYLRRLFGWLKVELPDKYAPAQLLIQQQTNFGLHEAQEFHALVVEFGKSVKNEQAFQQSFLKNANVNL